MLPLSLRWQDRPYAIVALGVLLCVLLYVGVTGQPWFGMDDAYIVAHNAQILHWGRDLNYVGSPALAGTTSAVHLLLVSLALFVLPPTWALLAVACGATVAYAMGLVRLARSCRLDTGPTLAVAALGLLVAQTPHQLMNGLETGLMLAAVTWAIALSIECAQDRRTIAFPLLCGIMPYMRPDLVPMSALLLVTSLSKRRGEAGWLARSARDVLLAAAASLPFALWYLHDLAVPYPTTAETKAAYFGTTGSWPMRAEAMLQALLMLLADMNIAVVGWYLLVRYAAWPLRLCFLAYTLVFLTGHLLANPGILSTYELRYFYVFQPWALAGFALGLARGRPWPKRLLWAALAVSVIAFPTRWSAHQAIRNYARTELAGIATWTRENLPSRSVLLIHDAGYIAFATPFRLVDLVGLKTPSSVADNRRFIGNNAHPRRDLAVDAIARRNHVTHFVELDSWEADSHLAAALRARGWKVTLISDPVRFRFRVYRLQLRSE